MTWSPNGFQADEKKWKKLLEFLRVGDEKNERVPDFVLVDEKLRSKCFDFSAFLSLNVEHAVEDAVEVHPGSWALVWLFLAASYPIHRYGKVSFSEMALVAVVGPTIVWLLLCWYVFRHVQNNLARKVHLLHDSVTSDHGSSCSDEEISVKVLQAAGLDRNDMSWLDRWFFSGHHLMRFAQVIGFIVCYVLSREAFDPPEWTEDRTWAILATVLLISIYFILSVWFYKQAPIFLALMSLPPRFNKYDENHMWKLLQDLLHDGIREQVFEAHMEELEEDLPEPCRRSHSGKLLTQRSSQFETVDC